MKRLLSKQEAGYLAAAAFIGFVVLPSLNLWTPETSAWHVSTFTLSLYGKYLTYAVLAMSVNLLWGYTGLLCLAQGLFFSLGGYALGMCLMRQIGHLGQYQSDIPDFMVFLEYKTKYAATGGLPRHWIPFNSFWFAAAAVIWVPVVVSSIFGYLAFRSRIKGVYFSILSQALTYAACLMFFRNDFTFGGNNGLTDFKFLIASPELNPDEIRQPAALAEKLNRHGANDPLAQFFWERLSTNTQAQISLTGDHPPDDGVLRRTLAADLNKTLAGPLLYDPARFSAVSISAETKRLMTEAVRPETKLRANRRLLEEAWPDSIAKRSFLGFEVNAASTRRALYACSVLLVFVVYLFCRWLTSTKLGLIQRAIRDSENRVLFSGYATAHYKLLVFVIAAVIAALGGALFVPQVGIINPSEMGADKSLEAVVWVALGGRGNMIGPILGAIGVNALKSYATHAFAEEWPYILGGLFVLVTLFMPEGLIGLPRQLRRLLKRVFPTPSPDPSATPAAALEPGKSSKPL